MNIYKIKVNQTWEEIYEIEAETEKDAVYLSVSDWIEPVKSTPTKSDIIEVTKLWLTNQLTEKVHWTLSQ